MNSDNKTQKALVAEDDRALADILRLALSRAGFEVSVAHDGRKALNAARATEFNVIVSDYQLPGLNGEQFLTGVREAGASSAARMILCSAKTYELDAERLRHDLNLLSVYYKPFSLNELIGTIRTG